jgi:hypothetical protein
MPVLLGVASEQIVSQDNAAVADCTVGGNGSGVLLLGDPDGDAGGAALVAEHHVRHHSMARRQVVESANSALKGAFADLSRGFFRVMGLVKVTVLLGFTLAAYNLDRIRSFKAKHGLDDNAEVVERPKQHRTRRRSDTWTEIIESGPAPPPT